MLLKNKLCFTHAALHNTSPGLHAAVTMDLGCAGVIGVAVTGFILDHAGDGTNRGWWQAFMVASAMCWGGSLLFISSAQGERLFGELNDF